MSNQPQKGGGPPMVKIDGTKARAIREDQGLTQLYVATAVGVTTDTISRWENNRYPAIKRENGLKLAEALSVDINDLLQEEQPDNIVEKTVDEPSEPEITFEGPDEFPVAAASEPAQKKKPNFLQLFLITFLIALGTIGGWFILAKKKTSLTAVRYAPEHFIPGQLFPVIIEVLTENDTDSSYVVKEQIPAGAAIISTLPKINNDNPQVSTIKWLNKDKTTNTYAYTLKADGEKAHLLEFHGSISEKDHQNIPITGQISIKASYHHWADADSDGKISDQEIMQAYNRYSTVPELDFEMIEEIWMGAGYSFDEKNKKIDIF